MPYTGRAKTQTQLVANSWSTNIFLPMLFLYITFHKIMKKEINLHPLQCHDSVLVRFVVMYEASDLCIDDLLICTAGITLKTTICCMVISSLDPSS